MKNQNTTTNCANYGLFALTAGIVIFTAGLILRKTTPGTIADTRLLEGLGILLAGSGIVPLIRAIAARRNPAAARRAMLEEGDERAMAIRHRAGYISFMVSSALSAVVLVGYSAFTRGQTGFDPLWIALVVLTVAPMIVFALATVSFNRK
ncbi:hypothetical protein hrd7_32990 (plasmid) [Leptolinea sp. HRD-7]|nr:hypothetical protein hrd7_32990 [Leptolinea sp. HRD-7]